MTGSILYFNECANQQLLLTSVTIHAEILNTTSTDRSSLLQTFQGVSSNQTKLATNLTVIYIYQAIHHHFQNIYYTIIHTYITQTPGLLRIYLVIQFSINIEQIYHVYPSSFFFLLEKTIYQSYHCGTCLVSRKALMCYYFFFLTHLNDSTFFLSYLS